MLGVRSSGVESNKIFNDYPSLLEIQRLHNAWIKGLPIGALHDVSYVDPNLVLEHVPTSDREDDSGDDYPDCSYRTMSGRGDGYRLRPTWSVAATQQDGNGACLPNPSPQEAPAAKKRKVLSGSFTHNQQLLSEESLSRINRQYVEDAWTSDRIRHWSETSFHQHWQTRAVSI